MGKKKAVTRTKDVNAEPVARTGSRHKPRKMVALPPDVYHQLQLLSEQNDRPLNRQLRSIVVDALKQAGLWPPPADDA